MHLRRALSLSEVLGGMSEGTGIKLIFLDACRDNQLTRAMRLEGAAVHAEGDTFIAFATAPNQVAHDGPGRNSPFTTALLEHIATQGLIIQEMMIDVARDVSIATSNCQRPWVHADLRVKFYFKPPELVSNSTADAIAKQTEKEPPAKKNATGDDNDIQSKEPHQAISAGAIIRALKERYQMPGAMKVAAIIGAAGSLSYIAFGVFGAGVLGFLILLAIYLPQAYTISEYLILAERDLNSWLRAWGGGLSADARKALAAERIRWLQMPETPDAKRVLLDMNFSDLATGGPQGFAIGRARFTAFLLREIYEGNVKNAQLKVYSEVKDGRKPYIGPGIRQILDYDKFDEKTGFPEGSCIPWFPLMLAVKLHRHPRNIIMVKPDRTVVENWAVIDELNRQLRPSIA